ncbi:G-protein coupled receptor Mth2-like [Epargyreus clarus]|uniref:G-protein coupled receptor Mth2-like n=1 Tax=Epargyreus clarus TaxID=520877 RepID=UPI003C2AED03
MVPFKMIILILIILGVVTAVPDDLLCCTRSSALTMDGHQDHCLDVRTNNTSPMLLNCELGFNIISPKHLNTTITDSGEVYFNMEDGKFEVQRDVFCLITEMVNTSIETDYLIAYCVEGEEDNRVLGYCMLISIIFLTMTTIVYAALPDIRDLQGKSIASLCTSFSIALGLLGISQIMEYSDMTWCAIRGFLMYYFLVSSFFWTNAIAIQILLSMRRPMVNNYDWKTFSWYALYAWGCPAILTLCMVIVNYHPGDHSKPGIGFSSCWFYSKKQQWYYLYSVMTILIVANTCIFIYTSIYLWRRSFSSSHVKTLRYKFIMSLRMFIIMGLPWVTEMISSLMEKHVIWYILDIFNMLQGFLIFLLLVVFRKRVVKALLKRGLLNCMAGPVERYLALGDDDEEGVIQHTIDHTMDERN